MNPQATVSAKLMQGYRAVARSTAKMLDAARGADWDRVVEEERRCREVIEGVKALGEVALNNEEAAVRHKLILQVLKDDAEIRALAQPWLRQLETLLGASGNARRLGASYGSAP